MILDYSTFLEDRHTSGSGAHSGPDNRKLFFTQRGLCPFCRIGAPEVYRTEDHQSYPPEEISDDPFFNPPGGGDIEQHKYTLAWSCLSCGWWELERSYADDWMYIQEIRHAVLRSFEPSDIALPVESLRKHLINKPELIYKIHWRKMEELVQSVFEEFFHCEVVHCGGSHDGGVDLLLISSDKPSVIQVKRRMNTDSVESVTTVRNLLGATLLQQTQHAILVTTADHFSPEARQEAAKAVTLDLVKSFNLINASRFFDMLQLVHKSKKELWRKYIW